MRNIPTMRHLPVTSEREREGEREKDVLHGHFHFCRFCSIESTCLCKDFMLISLARWVEGPLWFAAMFIELLGRCGENLERLV